MVMVDLDADPDLVAPAVEGADLRRLLRLDHRPTRRRDRARRLDRVVHALPSDVLVEPRGGSVVAGVATAATAVAAGHPRVSRNFRRAGRKGFEDSVIRRQQPVQPPSPPQPVVAPAGGVTRALPEPAATVPTAPGRERSTSRPTRAGEASAANWRSRGHGAQHLRGDVGSRCPSHGEQTRSADEDGQGQHTTPPMIMRPEYESGVSAAEPDRSGPPLPVRPRVRCPPPPRSPGPPRRQRQGAAAAGAAGLAAGAAGHRGRRRGSPWRWRRWRPQATTWLAAVVMDSDTRYRSLPLVAMTWRRAVFSVMSFSR